MSATTPTPQHEQHQEWYTREEAAAYLRISTVTLDRLRQAGKLLTARQGKVVRFRKEWLDAAIVDEAATS